MHDLKKLYPNSSYWLGSLKGKCDIKVDPKIPTVHAMRKILIESKEAIAKELDYLEEQHKLTLHYGVNSNLSKEAKKRGLSMLRSR